MDYGANHQQIDTETAEQLVRLNDAIQRFPEPVFLQLRERLLQGMAPAPKPVAKPEPYLPPAPAPEASSAPREEEAPACALFELDPYLWG